MDSSSSPILDEAPKTSYGSINSDDFKGNRLYSVPFLPDSDTRGKKWANTPWVALTWVMFLLLGVGTLLPWNLFITANDYFIRKSGIKQFEAYLVIAAQTPNFIFFFLTLFIKEFLAASFRIYISLGLMLSLFIVTIILTQVTINEILFNVITFFCIAVTNALSGLYQTTVLGVTGVFPNIQTQAVLVGQGVGGILPAVILVLSISTVRKIGIPSDSPTYVNTSSCIYFVFATLCIATCVGTYFSLTLIPFNRQYIRKLPAPRRFSFFTKLLPEIGRVVRFIWIDCFTVFFVFFITLALFPAIASAVLSQNKLNYTTGKGDICYCPGDNKTFPNISSGNHTTVDPCGDWTCLYFTPIFCFFAFNLFDSIGRTLAGFTAKCKVSERMLALLSIVRVVFIPLMLLCNVPEKKFFPYWLHFDAIFLTLIILLGISNGLLSSISMMHGPRRVDPSLGETATILMALFLGLGLLVGSCFSFVLEKIVVTNS